MSHFLLILTGFIAIGHGVFGESCVDKFCPPGTFCDERPGPCLTPPCRTIFVCLPVEANGCARLDCPTGRICVERVKPCIGRSCKKIATCELPNTCASLVCKPSERCDLNKTSKKPECRKHIAPTREIIGKAILDEKQFEH